MTTLGVMEKRRVELIGGEWVVRAVSGRQGQVESMIMVGLYDLNGLFQLEGVCDCNSLRKQTEAP